MKSIESFKRTLVFIFTVIFPLIIITLALSFSGYDKDLLEDLREEYSTVRIPSVDHSEFEELQVAFESPHEVTAACLRCHNQRCQEIMSSTHWTWEREAYIEGKGIVYLGKKNLVNNFCIGPRSNEGSCNRCHIGYGWRDKNFDFNNRNNIDCLVCHDNTGTYRKATGKAGYPPFGENAPDYNLISQNVGRPTKLNCGVCHFMGGGGNNVKHGDLEIALLNADKSLDIHMARDGMNLQCVDCHTTDRHQISGKYVGTSTTKSNRVSCTDCHGDFPHSYTKLNEHSIKVDCRTCHIPEFAKANATKVYWDWTTAGDTKDGEPYTLYDEDGNITYLSIKGSFKWKSNIIPEYVWYNGTSSRYMIGDEIKSDTLEITQLHGSYNDENAKIIPIKVHRSLQPYDKKYNNLIQLKVWDEDERCKDAFWFYFDFDRSIKAGMEYIGVPYSGEYGFKPTKVYLPVSHQVSQAENALTCIDCHHRTDSRLKNVEGVYIPATSYNKTLNLTGTVIIIMSILGVFAHGSLRYLSKKQKVKKIISKTEI